MYSMQCKYNYFGHDKGQSRVVFPSATFEGTNLRQNDHQKLVG